MMRVSCISRRSPLYGCARLLFPQARCEDLFHERPWQRVVGREVNGRSGDFMSLRDLALHGSCKLWTHCEERQMTGLRDKTDQVVLESEDHRGAVGDSLPDAGDGGSDQLPQLFQSASAGLRQSR